MTPRVSSMVNSWLSDHFRAEERQRFVGMWLCVGGGVGGRAGIGGCGRLDSPAETNKIHLERIPHKVR